MNRFRRFLEEGDLRTTGNVNEVIKIVSGQKDFDLLFKTLLLNDRKVVMRAADAIEKLTVIHPEYLKKHKKVLLKLLFNAKDKELKWHIAQLIPRLALNKKESYDAWKHLYFWAGDKYESRIVRVNSLQALFEMAGEYPDLKRSLDSLIPMVECEKIPSLIARLKRLRKEYSKSL